MITAPRLEIDLRKLHQNARTLVDRLSRRGIAVTGVTKSSLGSPELARVLLQAGVRGLGDSRIENIEAMRYAGIGATMTLIRSPMISQVGRVVAHADISANTELDVIAALSAAAGRADRCHGVLLMVELGDLREGVLPGDLDRWVRETLRFPNIVLKGIGTNLACRSGVAPDETNMGELSQLAEQIETDYGLGLDIVSGGNSSNLDWLSKTSAVGRINDLRLGEAIHLGREALNRHPIPGLHLDVFTLVAEIIEAKVKPPQPWGTIAETAFGAVPPRIGGAGPVFQVILAIGRQDTDPDGLEPPEGFSLSGASSDHLILEVSDRLPSVGEEIRFQVNYSALLRAMTSPFVNRAWMTPGAEVEVPEAA